MLQPLVILLSHAGSPYNALAAFLSPWSSVIVFPHCGGCIPTDDSQEDCEADSLYSWPCSAEEMSFDWIWLRPALNILRCPATLEETSIRVEHLDSIVYRDKLELLLQQAEAFWRSGAFDLVEGVH